jgi:hypothetical protein
LVPSPAGGQPYCPEKRRFEVTLTVPKHIELKPGFLRNLIKAAGLTVEEFEAFLK